MKGNILFRVSKDMMQAVVWKEPAGESEITTATIQDLLEEQGIKAGIDKSAIEQCVADKNYGNEYIVATGKEPTDGKDGYFEFFFDRNLESTKPKIREDGSVDYSLQRQLVQSGQLLCNYHPAKGGAFGYTVFASVIAPVAVKDLPPYHTTGVEKKDNQYFATVNGEVHLNQDTLFVDDKLIIYGDASNATGEVRFNGDIQIQGDVLSNVHVVADGSVEVFGVVEGARIEAGKDIIVKHGIHGMEKAILKAKGSVYASFIEEAHIEAEENIVFNYMCNSTVYAKKHIRAEGRAGSILGGTTIAGESILAKRVGNESETRTKLKIQSSGELPTPYCKITVSSEAFDGAEFEIEGVPFKGQTMPIGEYHLVNNAVQHFTIGSFVINTPLPKVEKEEKKTILLVDDEPMILKTFFGYLNPDYKVLAANSAKDAFAILEHTRPDLVLLDINMPNMNGIQMLNEMRSKNWKSYHDVPVMFATAITDKRIVEKCMTLYPQGYLIKPLNKDELHDVVDNFFSKNQKSNTE